MQIKHDAFVSYNHGADAALARALEAGLEKLAKPLLALRAIDVFRDETSLAANPSLWAGILDHLAGSSWLVLLACPEWAASPWCCREAQWWLANRPFDRMLVVITGGDLIWDGSANDFDWAKTTALSKDLRGHFKEEPLYVDLRWARGLDGLTLSNLRFRDAVLNLAAAIRGVRKDELDGADVRQMRRNRRLVQAGVTAIVIAAAVAIWQAIVATQQRDEAIRQAQIALSRGLGSLAQQKLSGENAQLDVALLVAAQAVRLDPGTMSTSVLRSALQRYPGLQRLLWPGARAYAVEYSPDGRRLASAGEDGAISIWDAANGVRQRKIVDAHQDKIWALAFSPDGKMIVSASLDKTMAVWDAESGVLVGQRMSGHSDQILALAVSRDGRLAATACLDGSVWLWDLARRQTTHQIAGAHKGGARAVAFSADGATLVTGGFDGLIKAWSTQTGEPRPAPGAAHERGVLRLVYSPDGDVLASSGQDGTVQRWDTRTWKPLFSKPFEGSARPVYGLAFSPDGKELAAGGEDGHIVIWRPGASEDETVERRIGYHKNQVWQVAFSPDGQSLVAASWDISISLWDARQTVGLRSALSDFPKGMHGLAFHPKSSVLALGAPDGRIFLQAVDDLSARRRESERRVLQGPKDEVLALAFSASGNLLASSTLDGSISVWDLRTTPRLVWTAKHAGTAVFSLGFTPDETMLVTASADGSLARWDIRSGAMLGPPEKPHLNGAGSSVVAFHPRGKYFATAGRGGDVVLWDAASGKRLQTILKGGSDSEMSGFDGLAFSPDSRTLIAATGGSAYVWRDEAWDKPDKVFLSGGHIAFSADSRILAIGSSSGVELWDVESRQVLGTPFAGPGRSVWGLALSADGRRLAAAFPDNPAYVWTLDLREWIAQACQIANRDLLTEEWRELVGPFPYEKTCVDLAPAAGSLRYRP